MNKYGEPAHKPRFQVGALVRIRSSDHAGKTGEIARQLGVDSFAVRLLASDGQQLGGRPIPFDGVELESI